MGDYVKLIVNAEVEMKKEDLEKELKNLGLLDSAYHCSGVVKRYDQSTYRPGILEVILVGQTKYGVNQEEFLDWLAPFVRQGSGPDEIWAIQISEYDDSEPVFRKMRNNK